MPEQLEVEHQAHSTPNQSTIANKVTAAATSTTHQQQHQPQWSRKASLPSQCCESLSKSSSATGNSVNCSPAQISVAFESTLGEAGSGSISSNNDNDNNKREEKQYQQQAASHTQPQLRRPVGGHTSAPAAALLSLNSTGMGGRGVSQRASPSSSSSRYHPRQPTRAACVSSLAEDNRGFLNPEYAKDLSSDDDHYTDGTSYDDTEGSASAGCVRAPSLAIFPLTVDERQAVRDAYAAYAVAEAAAPHHRNLIQLLRELHGKAHERKANTRVTGSPEFSPPATEFLETVETSLGTLRFRKVMSGAAPAHRRDAPNSFTLEDAFRYLGVLKFDLASHLFTEKRRDRPGGDEATAGVKTAAAATAPAVSATAAPIHPTIASTISGDDAVAQRSSPSASLMPPLAAFLVPLSLHQTGSVQLAPSPHNAAAATTAIVPAPPKPPPQRDHHVQNVHAQQQQQQQQQPVFPPAESKLSLPSELTAAPVTFLPTTPLMCPATRPPYAAPGLISPHKSNLSAPPTTSDAVGTAAASGGDSFRAPPSAATASSPPGVAAAETQTQLHAHLVRSDVVQGPARRRRQRSTPALSSENDSGSHTESALCRDAAVRAYVERRAFSELTEGQKGAQRRVSLDRLVEALRLFELGLHLPTVARACGGMPLEGSAVAAGAQVDFVAFALIMEAGLHHPLGGDHHHHYNTANTARGALSREGGDGTAAGNDATAPMFFLELRGDLSPSHAGPSSANRSGSAAVCDTTSNRDTGHVNAASLHDSLLSSKTGPPPPRGANHSRSNSSLAASVASLTKSSSDTDDPYPVMVAEDSAMAALCREIRWRLRTAAHRSANENADVASGGAASTAAAASPPRPLPPGMMGPSSASMMMLPLPISASQSPASSPLSQAGNRSESHQHSPRTHLYRPSTTAMSLLYTRQPSAEALRQPSQRSRPERGPALSKVAAATGKRSPSQQGTSRRRHNQQLTVRSCALKAMRPADSLQQWQREMVPPPSGVQWTAPHPYGPASIATAAAVGAAAPAASGGSNSGVAVGSRGMQRLLWEGRRSHSNSSDGSTRSGPLLCGRRRARVLRLRRPTPPFDLVLQGGEGLLVGQRAEQHQHHSSATSRFHSDNHHIGSTTSTTASACTHRLTSVMMSAPSATRLPRRRPPLWEQVTALSPYNAAPMPPSPSRQQQQQKLAGVNAHLGGATRFSWWAPRYTKEEALRRSGAGIQTNPPQSPVLAPTMHTPPVRPASPVLLRPRHPFFAVSSVRKSRPSTAPRLSLNLVEASVGETGSTLGLSAAVLAGTPSLAHTPQHQPHVPSSIVTMLAPSPPSPPSTPQPLGRGLLRPQRPSLLHIRSQERQHHHLRRVEMDECGGSGDVHHPYATARTDSTDAATATMPVRTPCRLAPSPPTEGLPQISAQRLRRELLLSELAEMHMEHKALTQRLATLSSVASHSPETQMEMQQPHQQQLQHCQPPRPPASPASSGVPSQQARLQESMECEAALNVVSRRIHRYLAELAVDGPLSVEDQLHVGCLEARGAAARAEEETRRRKEGLAYAVAEACQGAVAAAQHVVPSSLTLAPAGTGVPPPSPRSLHHLQQHATVQPLETACAAAAEGQVSLEVGAPPPSSEVDGGGDGVGGPATAVDTEREGSELVATVAEGRRSVDPTTATSLQESSVYSGPPDFCRPPSDNDGPPHSSSASPSQDSLRASTVPTAADSAYSRLTQRPQLPTALSLHKGSARTDLTEPLSVREIYRIGHSTNPTGSPKQYVASETEMQDTGRSSREPSTCEHAKSPEASAVASTVVAAPSTAAVAADAATTTATVVVSPAPTPTPHAPSSENLKSASTALSGLATASSVGLPPLPTSPYSPPMMRPRGSSSSTKTGTTTATSLPSTAAVAAGAFDLHGCASMVANSLAPPEPNSTAAAMEAAGGMYDDDSPSPRANFYLEWAVTQLEQRQRLQEQKNSNDQIAAHTGSTTDSFTTRLRNVLPPQASGSGVHSTQLQAPSSGLATGTTTTATTNSSWTTSRAFSTPGIFTRPPMGANRSTASSSRAVHNSQSASKPGSGNSDTGMASFLTERHSHSLSAPMAAASDNLRSEDRPAQGRSSMTTSTDEAALLGYSAGDRTALLRRSLAPAGASRSHASFASQLTSGSFDSNSTLHNSAISAPLDFMGSMTWNMSARSRHGGQALRSGHSSNLYRMTRSSARPFSGADNQRSYSAYERTVSSIMPAGFSGSMFPERDRDGNIIPRDEG